MVYSRTDSLQERLSFIWADVECLAPEIYYSEEHSTLLYLNAVKLSDVRRIKSKVQKLSKELKPAQVLLVAISRICDKKITYTTWVARPQDLINRYLRKPKTTATKGVCYVN